MADIPGNTFFVLSLSLPRSCSLPSPLSHSTFIYLKLIFPSVRSAFTSFPLGLDNDKWHARMYFRCDATPANVGESSLPCCAVPRHYIRLQIVEREKRDRTAWVHTAHNSHITRSNGFKTKFYRWTHHFDLFVNYWEFREVPMPSECEHYPPYTALCCDACAQFLQTVGRCVALWMSIMQRSRPCTRLAQTNPINKTINLHLNWQVENDQTQCTNSMRAIALQSASPPHPPPLCLL